MSLNQNRIQQLSLIGVIAVLLIVLAWFGFNSKTAKYDKPIVSQNEMHTEDADIFGLLRRFAGSNEEINITIDNLEKDSLKIEYIQSLDSAGIFSEIEVFQAYSSYLKGIKQTDLKLLQLAANLFFEAGTHDPDSLADKTTYSVYAKRACNRILDKDPKNLEAITRKATCAIYFEGSVMEGVGLLKEAESIDSNYVEAQHHLMLLALQSGQYEKAVKRLKKLLSLQPDNKQYADLLLKTETQLLK